VLKLKKDGKCKKSISITHIMSIFLCKNLAPIINHYDQTTNVLQTIGTWWWKGERIKNNSWR
jgi:hypothetical protein